MKQLQCIECKGWYDEDFFRVNREARIHASRKLRCKECEQQRRDLSKSSDRWIVKARNAYNSHASKFLRLGIIKSRRELTEKFGWVVANMAHDMEHVHKNGCPGCRRLFSEMPNGLQGLELDIHNPKEPPYYSFNVRWICQSCNRGKGNKSPSDYARHQALHEKAIRLRAQLAADPYKDTLLAGLISTKAIKID